MTRLSGGTVVAMLIGAMALAACTERPQEGAKSAKRADAQAWQGGGDPAFMAGDWRSGDRSAWESQLKARNEKQNEYARTQQ
jgi:hypothetical protein